MTTVPLKAAVGMYPSATIAESRCGLMKRGERVTPVDPQPCVEDALDK
jgi:hypothetical protein